MTRKSILRQRAGDGRDGTDKDGKSSGASSEAEVRNSGSEPRKDQPNNDAALVASNLQRLPTWIPISDYLLRNGDPFPYGKMPHYS
ncbi:hypothetical protein F4824DRAFT_499852 [Ustulina deusta]|nr:hypothetical protein F4824DRAFT_499852 [Ustulina deusta]